MTNITNQEKDLFDPLASIAGADIEPPRKLPMGASVEDEPAKKPAARANKPHAYYLYRDDELTDAYDTAAEAFKGLTAERYDEFSLARDGAGIRIMAPDQEGMMQEMSKKDKQAVDIQNLLRPTRDVAVYTLSDDMKHDLRAEGFKTSRAREGVIEKSEETSAAHTPEAAPLASTQSAEATHNQPTFNDTMKGLMEANQQLNAVRNSMPKAEWERRISAALNDVAPPVTNADNKPSDFKIWLADNKPREQQSATEDDPAKKYGAAMQSSQDTSHERDHDLN